MIQNQEQPGILNELQSEIQKTYFSNLEYLFWGGEKNYDVLAPGTIAELLAAKMSGEFDSKIIALNQIYDYLTTDYKVRIEVYKNNEQLVSGVRSLIENLYSNKYNKPIQTDLLYIIGPDMNSVCMQWNFSEYDFSNTPLEGLPLRIIANCIDSTIMNFTLGTIKYFKMTEIPKLIRFQLGATISISDTSPLGVPDSRKLGSLVKELSQLIYSRMPLIPSIRTYVLTDNPLERFLVNLIGRFIANQEITMQDGSKQRTNNVISSQSQSTNERDLQAWIQSMIDLINTHSDFARPDYIEES